MSQNVPASTNNNEPRRNKLLLALGGVVGTALCKRLSIFIMPYSAPVGVPDGLRKSGKP